ncbi:MAG: cupin domain-containing protein, partial [Candidatus Kapabacteria bacterium]|nr:cupin domain-containing protein [Candidatus Kapabacteria bacterium]
MKTAFDEFPMRHGLLYDYSHNQFPTKLYAYTGEPMTFHKSENTVFVYASAPTEVLVQSPFGDMIPYTLLAGMYLSGSMVRILSGKGIAIERLGYSGQFMLGGPIEQKGRLKYIDGCTDSLLIPPVKYGDPCLNALYFPAGIDQTAHTHPSMRVGMIVSGKGECVT